MMVEMMANSRGGSAWGEGGSLTTFTSLTISGGETAAGFDSGGSRRPALAGPNMQLSTRSIRSYLTW